LPDETPQHTLDVINDRSINAAGSLNRIHYTILLFGLESAVWWLRDYS